MTTTPDGFYYVDYIFNPRGRRIQKDAILCPSCVANLVLKHHIWGYLEAASTVVGRQCDLCDTVQHD